MKSLICFCVVLSVAAVTPGQSVGGFGEMMKQAAGGMQQMMGMFPGMGKDGGPFGDMMKQFEGMVGQAGAPEQMMEMFEKTAGQMTEQGQKTMEPFMEQMGALKDQGAPPEKFMELLNQMKKAAGQ